MLWLEMTGMMTRVSEGFVKSNAKMRKVAKSRETKNRQTLAGVKKELSQALDKIKKMENTLRTKDEEIVQISNERDGLKTELEDVKKNLTEKTSENEGLHHEVNQTKEENRELQQNIEEKTIDIRNIQKKMEDEIKSHTKEKVELEEEKGKVESELGFVRSTNFEMSKALAIHTEFNLRREQHNAEVDETEETAREAKRFRAEFEKSSAKEVKKVDEAVGLLINGELDYGKRKISEVETSTAAAAAAAEEKRRRKNEKRNQKRAKAKRSREGLGEDGDGSALLIEEEDEENEAHGVL